MKKAARFLPKGYHALWVRLWCVILIASGVILGGCSTKISDSGETERLQWDRGSVFDESQSAESSELLESSVPVFAETETEETSEESEKKSLSGEEMDFSITMLDVGQGLSLLMESDGEYALYDGGDRDASSYVVSYLSEHGVDHLTYMFASHYDSDHIAGLVGVLNTVETDTVICPDYETDTNIYYSFLSALQDSGADALHPEPGEIYYFGDTEIQVLNTYSPAYTDVNENSVAVRVSCGDFSCLISGDAESEAEEAMLNSGLELSSELYVAGHHGSSSSSSAAFVEAVSPSYAFISCGAGNPYGHPTAKTLSTLDEYGVQIFRSDLQGEVSCMTDGSTFSFSTEPTQDRTPGNSEAKPGTQREGTSVSDDSSKEDAEGTYILNTNSKKFHLPDCDSVQSMSEKNREEYTGKRSALIEQGYTPCGNCRP